MDFVYNFLGGHFFWPSSLPPGAGPQNLDFKSNITRTQDDCHLQVIFPTVDILSDLSLAGRLWRGQDKGIERRFSLFSFQLLIKYQFSIKNEYQDRTDMAVPFQNEER